MQNINHSNASDRSDRAQHAARGDRREAKTQVYRAFSDVAKALGSPRRLEILDLLLQGPRSVEGIAQAASQPLPSASQHLQVLKRSRLVQTNRRGTTIEYSLAPGVAQLVVHLRDVAEARSPTLLAARAALHGDADETIGADALRAAMDAGEVTLIDVRPATEYRHAHVPGARSLPIGELEARLGELPRDRLVVATCRGPYCVFATDAVRMVRQHGLRAVRFEQGPGEWVAAGGALAHGDPS